MRCLGRLAAAVEQAGGALLITADHGNAEMMRDPDDRRAAHRAYAQSGAGRAGQRADGDGRRCGDGQLADVAPTLLALMGLPQPAEMTGRLADVAAAARSRGVAAPCRRLIRAEAAASSRCAIGWLLLGAAADAPASSRMIAGAASKQPSARWRPIAPALDRSSSASASETRRRDRAAARRKPTLRGADRAAPHPGCSKPSSRRSNAAAASKPIERGDRRRAAELAATAPAARRAPRTRSAGSPCSRRRRCCWASATPLDRVRGATLLTIAVPALAGPRAAACKQDLARHRRASAGDRSRRRDELTSETDGARGRERAHRLARSRSAARSTPRPPRSAPGSAKRVRGARSRGRRSARSLDEARRR